MAIWVCEKPILPASRTRSRNRGCSVGSPPENWIARAGDGRIARYVRIMPRTCVEGGLVDVPGGVGVGETDRAPQVAAVRQVDVAEGGVRGVVRAQPALAGAMARRPRCWGSRRPRRRRSRTLRPSGTAGHRASRCPRTGRARGRSSPSAPAPAFSYRRAGSRRVHSGQTDSTVFGNPCGRGRIGRPEHVVLAGARSDRLPATGGIISRSPLSPDVSHQNPIIARRCAVPQGKAKKFRRRCAAKSGGLFLVILSVARISALRLCTRSSLAPARSG